MPCLGGRAREEEGREPGRHGSCTRLQREERTGSLGKKAQFLSLLSLSLFLSVFRRLFFTVRSLRCSVLPASSFLLSRATESIRLCSTGEVTTGHRLNQSVRFSLASPSIVRLVLLPSSRFLPTFERTPCYVAAAAVVSGILLASVRRSYACTRYPDYAKS